MKRALFIVLFVAAAAFPFAIPPRTASGSVAAAEPLVVFCVRHAEKEEGRDPGLTSVGTKRAADLAAILRDAGITHVHSTDYKRTRLTGKPLAEKLGVKTTLYDPRRMPALVEKMKKIGGRHLVVGHSNTTPTLVRMLGGKAGQAITEKEYDRLYAVTLNGEGVSTVLLRF